MQHNLVPIKIVAFDFDGVFPMGGRVSNYEESLFRNIKKITKGRVEKGKIYQMFNQFLAHDLSERVSHRSGKLTPYLKNFLKEADLKGESSHLIIEAMLDKKTFYPLTKKIEPIFKFLVSNEIKIVMISDSIFPTIMRRIMLQHWGLLQYFDLVLTSQENGRKTGLHIFKKVATFFKVRPGEILHVGDELLHDVIPAKRAGLQTCLIVSRKLRNQKTEAKTSPDFIITDLRELSEVVEKRKGSENI